MPRNLLQRTVLIIGKRLKKVRCLHAIVFYEYTFEKQMGYINNII